MKSKKKIKSEDVTYEKEKMKNGFWLSVFVYQWALL